MIDENQDITASELRPLDEALGILASQLRKIRDENPGISWAEAAQIRQERLAEVVEADAVALKREHIEHEQPGPGTYGR